MQGSTQSLMSYLSAHIEAWLHLTLSGNSALTLEVLRLLHTAAESSSHVHQAALEAAVLPALLDLLRTLTEGSAGLHVDDTVTSYACDVLDWFLLSARLPHTASVEDFPSPHEIQVVLDPQITALLAAQLALVVGQSESTAVGAAALKCLYRMACMEEDPVPNVPVKQCRSIRQSTTASAQQLHGSVAVEHVGDCRSRCGSSRHDQLSKHDTAVKKGIESLEVGEYHAVSEVSHTACGRYCSVQ